MTTINAARRAFLKRRIGPASIDHHMPWAVAAFLDLCQRCDDCIRACEPAIVVRGDGGFPTVDFGRGGCTFCGACERACQYGALDRRQVGPAWRLRAVIGDACLSANGITCRACGDACDAGAIRFRPQLGGRAAPGLDATRCSGCGGCVAVCPGRVIQIQEAA
jgi:ferredoxin-type protein NapF